MVNGLIKKKFSTKNPLILIKLYKAYTLPILEYGSSIWAPYDKCDTALLEKIQRNLTKRLCPDKALCYKERLKYFKLLSLENRRLICDLMKMHRLIHYDTERLLDLHIEKSGLYTSRQDMKYKQK